MADKRVEVFITPVKKSFSYTVSQAIFSRSNMKKKIRLLSRVFSSKKKRSWNPRLYSPEIFQDGQYHGNYETKTSPAGIPRTVANSVSTKDSTKLLTRNAVINLGKKFDLLARREKLKDNKGDNSYHFSNVGLESRESSPAVKTCVINMSESDASKTVNPFFTHESVIKLMECKKPASSIYSCTHNVRPTYPPKSSLVSDPDFFKTLDKRALEVSEKCYTDIKSLAADLTGGCVTELEKVRVIFRWVIAMDQKNAQMHGFMASYVLGSGKESCQKLFAELCRQAGLNCKIIMGYSKGAGYKPGMRIDDSANRNSWTAVSIDGTWRFVNCTWAARHRTGNNEFCSLLHKLDEFYFLTDPDQHIFQHYPDEQQWQLLDSPVTLEDFKRLPTLKSPFFKHGLEFTEPCSSLISTKSGSVEVRLRGSPALQYGGKLESDGLHTNHLESFILTRKVEDEVLFRIRLPQKGSYVFSAFAGTSDNMGYLECIFSLEITCRGHNMIGPFPPVPVLGQTDSLLRQGLSTLSHHDPYIQLDDNSLQMDFVPEEEMTFSHTLQYYEENSSSFIDIDRYAFMSTRSQSRLTYSIACPRKGSYLFCVFGNSPKSQTYDCLYQYLIVCLSDDLSQVAFPKSSSGWTSCKLHSPLCGYLVQDSDYFFHLVVPGADDVFVLVGTNRQHLEWSKMDNWTGHVFTGSESTKAVVLASFTTDTGTPTFVRLLTYDLL